MSSKKCFNRIINRIFYQNGNGYPVLSDDLLTYLCNLSAEAVRNVWISGEHFQRSRLGAGSSLMLAALTNLEGLPLL